MKSYTIYSPGFEITSGGVRVMYGLYGWLLAKGQVAFMNQYIANSDHVVIYPEIYSGENTSGASPVVRYILQKPGRIALVDGQGKATLGPAEFPKSERLYAFSRMYYKGLPDERYLFLPILNTYVFKDYGLKRTKTAYFVGKGNNGHLHPENSIEITRMFAQDQTALAKLLNECEVLYSYDPVSAITEIARLCGCRIVLKQDWFTEKEYQLYEAGTNGISFYWDSKVKLDSSEFTKHYQNMIKDFEKKLDIFIKETQ